MGQRIVYNVFHRTKMNTDTAALVYVRKAANTNSTINSAKFPVNLTPVLFSGRGDPVKKNSTTPTFREFQVN